KAASLGQEIPEVMRLRVSAPSRSSGRCFRFWETKPLLPGLRLVGRRQACRTESMHLRIQLSPAAQFGECRARSSPPARDRLAGEVEFPRVRVDGIVTAPYTVAGSTGHADIAAVQHLRSREGAEQPGRPRHGRT